MAVPGLVVSKERHPDALVVSVSGELDISTATQLELEVRDLGDGSRLVLDLTELEFVDSTGLRTLVLTARAAANGCAFVCPSDNHAVQRLLEFFGVPDAYEVHETRAEAGLT